MRVSVLLPCFNAARFLSACMESLLEQTFGDFEILALDDGSQDDTLDLLKSFTRDERVRVIHRAQNRGLIATLNEGLGLARGDYVARMDADDEALPERFAKQVSFLDAHPEVDVVSSSAIVVDDSGRVVGRRAIWATEPAACRFVTTLATPVIHPAVMARRAVFVEFGYSTEDLALHTEDYELWSRLVRSGRTLANLREPLLRLRVQPDRVSFKYESIQRLNFVRCVERQLRHETGRELPPAVVATLANRIAFDQGPPPLRDALAVLLDLTRHARDAARGQPLAQREIQDVAEIQTIYILLQCLKRGSMVVRLQALARLAWSVLTATSEARRFLGRAIRGALGGKRGAA